MSANSITTDHDATEAANLALLDQWVRQASRGLLTITSARTVTSNVSLGRTDGQPLDGFEAQGRQPMHGVLFSMPIPQSYLLNRTNRRAQADVFKAVRTMIVDWVDAPLDVYSALDDFRRVNHLSHKA